MYISPIPLCDGTLSHRETEYAVDAVLNGHSRPYTYVNLLQRGMSRYAGQRYALAVNSPHAAMHLLLLALRVRPGDEILLPELADAFVPAAIMHAGAEPVFCDVDPRSLCLSPEAAEKRLSDRTRALAVVHMYGQLCDMDAFSAMAEKHHIPLVEIATGGMGAMWKDKPAGSFGLFSLFSMGPGDPVTAGGGAVLSCSDKNLTARAVKYAFSRGTKGSRLSFDYGMSNVQAAVAHGQMERIDELTAKKQEIHAWYKQELEGVAGVSLPEAVPGSFHSRLMNVLRLDPDGPPPIRLLDRLKRAQIQAELVPAPLSFRPQYTKYNNPVSLRASSASVLLPGGRNLTREEVGYICGVIKNAVRDIRGLPALTGRLKYQSDLIGRIVAIKRDGLKIPFPHEGKKYVLNAVTTAMAEESRILDVCARLREENAHAVFPGPNSARACTERFMRRYIEIPWDFLLFLVEEAGAGRRVWGHVGLNSFDSRQKSCEVNALMMLPEAPRGLASAANAALHRLAAETFGMGRLYAQFRRSNVRARLFAAGLGFREINNVAFYRGEEAGEFTLRPMYAPGNDNPAETDVLAMKELRHPNIAEDAAGKKRTRAKRSSGKPKAAASEAVEKPARKKKTPKTPPR